ncbi:hypothetical protein HDV03_005203 [Kappamyces sp. JEL0829]|nr:hypothetical protein HDV03_005203 [Kappamyces sp. JEL0829]
MNPKADFAEIQKYKVPLQVPEAAYATIAKSAEPSITMPMSRISSDTINPEFRVVIPNEDVLVYEPAASKPADGIYGSVVHSVSKAASTVWSGIESLSLGVSDFFGITAPRYELWIEDSIKYQAELALAKSEAEERKDYENQAILKGMANTQSLGEMVPA